MTTSDPPRTDRPHDAEHPLELLTHLAALGLGPLELDPIEVDWAEILADLHYGRDGRAA